MTKSFVSKPFARSVKFKLLVLFMLLFKLNKIYMESRTEKLEITLSLDADKVTK